MSICKVPHTLMCQVPSLHVQTWHITLAKKPCPQLMTSMLNKMQRAACSKPDKDRSDLRGAPGDVQRGPLAVARLHHVPRQRVVPLLDVLIVLRTGAGAG